jgi:AcrR family transcriptional regulator
MSSVVDNASSRRRHDAEASRQALLDAATALFDERGYDGATVRDIGERARVDPALIARYFGCKERLYLEALGRDDRPALPSEPLEAIARVLAYHDERGSGPVLRAMVNPTLSDTARRRLGDVVGQRLTGPLHAALEERGVADARLRAELVVAMIVGMALTRSGRTLPTLADADLDDVMAVLEPVIAALETGTQGR